MPPRDDDPPDTSPPTSPSPATPALPSGPATSVPTPSSARRVFRVLHDGYRRFVGRLVRGQLRGGDREPNPASVEDVVQEVFIRLDRVVKKARLRNPEAMLVTLVGREAGSYRQKRPPVRVDIEIAPAASPAPDPARTAELHERLRRLQKHLDGMEPADAQVIVYLDVFEMTLEQVAEMQNRSVTAVFNHRKRARRILDERLRPDGEGEPVSGRGGG